MKASGKCYDSQWGWSRPVGGSHIAWPDVTARSCAGDAEAASKAPEADAEKGTPLASEHAEIASRLMAAGPGGVDVALLTAAAKALRDVSVLDKQLLRAREVRLNRQRA